MPRQVDDTQPYQDKLVKLIPTEIVGAYMVLTGILGVDPTSAAIAGQIPDSVLKPVLIQVVFFALLVLTPIYNVRVNRVSNIAQVVVTTLSYVVWVYTLGGPFVVWHVYYPVIGSVVLVLWSLIAPLIVASNQP